MLLWILVAVLGKPLKDTYTDFTTAPLKPKTFETPAASYAYNTAKTTYGPKPTAFAKPETYETVKAVASHPTHAADTIYGPKPASVGIMYPAKKKPVFTEAPLAHHFVEPTKFTKAPVVPRSTPKFREELASAEPTDYDYTDWPHPESWSNPKFREELASAEP